MFVSRLINYYTMFKKIIISTLLLFSFGFVNAQNAANNNSSNEYFAQGYFVLPENQDVQALNDHLAQNSDIKIFRFDTEHNLFIVFTKEIETFDKTVLLSWLGSYISSASCIQIGVQDIDERNAFPFQNCND